MTVRVEHFEDHARGRPYHAALVELKGDGAPHRHHDYFEVMAVLEGTGRQELRTATGTRLHTDLQPGDVFFLRPGDQHTLRGTGSTGVRFFNIAFPAGTWRSFTELAGLGSWATASGPPLHTRGDASSVLARCRAALDRFHNVPTTFDLLTFWTGVVPLLAPPNQVEKPVAPTPPDWLVEACSAMSSEENLRGGVPRLTALAHVSPAHLSRSTRRHYNTTPTALVTELRLRHAATLLATTTRSITQIAHHSGFASHSYFTRRFREKHGISPRAFRHHTQRAFVP